MAALAAMALAGCASPGAKPVEWDGTYEFGTPGEAVDSYVVVPYYPACGNEILTWEDATWYPFEPSNPAAFPADPLADAPSPSPMADAAGGPGSARTVAMPVGAVAAPGPGDDVGTLVVYENGLAYWVSESRGLDTWLTDRALEYNWVC